MTKIVVIIIVIDFNQINCSKRSKNVRRALVKKKKKHRGVEGGDRPQRPDKHGPRVGRKHCRTQRFPSHRQKYILRTNV